MDLGTVFKFSLYGLTVIVGAILGAAEGEGVIAGTTRHELLLPYLSLPVVICGFLFTEQRVAGRSTSSGRGLSPLWANLLAILALIATGYQFSSENREGKLLAGAHLLLYSTWIVLFQKKTIRLYWFLLALGILQLSVSSVLTTKGWFGFSAIGYMFCAVWTLSIFSLWRAEQSFNEEDRIRKADDANPGTINATTSSLTRTPSEVRSGLQHEDGTQWLTARFVSGVLMTTLSALVVGAAFFAFIPRVWVGSEFSFQEDSESSAGLIRKMGMATSVRLGDLGRVLESSERVFEIQITQRETKAPIPVENYATILGMAEPLFRGAVFTYYEKGRWSSERGTEIHARPFKRAALDSNSTEAEVRQTIQLDPTSSTTLFCLGKPISMSVNNLPYGDYNYFTGISTRSDTKSDGVLEYSVITRLPTQEQMNYRTNVSSSTLDRYRGSGYLKNNKQLPTGLNRLKKLAQEIIEAETAQRQKAEGRSTPRQLKPLEIASALEFYLRDSGVYKYSLDLSVQDSKIDPVEDFLFNRKLGHCEYFATALALMIRSANIPARVVSGYKGGIAHPNRHDALEVQQRFAHLWTEAWVDDEGWTTFDATPREARTLSIAAISSKSKISLWTEMQTTLSGLWSENVLNMSLARQERSIYKPMRELAFSLLQFVQQLFTSPREAFQTLWNLLKNGEEWLSIGGLLFAISCLAILAGMIWLIRRLWKLSYAWYSRQLNSHNQQRRRVIAFYERFVRLMRARGLKRDLTQTQQEFAEQVTDACRSELSTEGLENAPQQLSQLFYRVRFGDEEMTANEFDQLEAILNRLERALSNEIASHKGLRAAAHQ